MNIKKFCNKYLQNDNYIVQDGYVIINDLLVTGVWEMGIDHDGEHSKLTLYDQLGNIIGIIDIDLIKEIETIPMDKENNIKKVI